MAEAREYEFSFVIPAYNCEDYVEDAILSVVEQSVGFEQNIQLVLVDDGSSDGTARICQMYADLFPQNVVFISQENAGANAARRTGLAHATGKYVNFLDADDMWSLDACEHARRFFHSNPGVGVTTARHYFFEAKSAPHHLDFKFEKTQVINLEKTYDYPQMSMNNAFVRRDLLSPELFETKLQVSEDFLVINLILLEELRYGVMKEPTYWYRKRDVGDSAIDTSGSNLSWYFDSPELCYRRLFEESKTRFGRILPFLQFSVMCDLQWRIKQRIAHPLDADQLAEYRELIVGLLTDIDDSIILEQRNLSRPQKLYTFGMKYGFDARAMQQGLSVSGNKVLWTHPQTRHKVQVSVLAEDAKITIQFIRAQNGKIVMEGRIPSVVATADLGLRAIAPDYQVEARVEPRLGRRYDTFFETNYFTESGFYLELPWDGKARTVRFEFLVDGKAVPANLISGKFCPISFRPFDFTFLGDAMLCIVGRKRDRLQIQPPNQIEARVREVAYEAAQVVAHPETRSLMPYRRYALENALRRLKASAASSSTTAATETERIWLISDRTTMAGDNGEALFTYLHDHPQPGVKPYFVINADSPDFERMKQYGQVVAYRSPEHIKLHVRADKIISSAADEHVFDLLGPNKYLTKNFERFDYVFLQHGITQNDISHWLNRFNKNIAIFVTAAKPERDSILQNPAYYYTDEQVALTGFTRHDKLIARAATTQPQRKVLVAPTWRQSITGTIDPKTGWRKENPSFNESDYYCFFQGLLNSPKLAQAAQELGYTVDFLIHPALAQEAHKFTSDFANIVTEYDYASQFVTSSIMVTDYSSVAFDFALLKKPLIYAQFDQYEFYESHPWEHGYFECERDGFGDVCTDLDSTLDALIALMRNPKMSQKYEQRVDDFFFEPPAGTTRCQLLLDALAALDERKSKYDRKPIV